ncbi:MAG: exosortase system-associated protein, TIGR04073 family [Mariprofundaceae bacterium]
MRYIFALLTVALMAATPVMAAGNPCNPCSARMANPCNPCAAKMSNPCNPCGGKMWPKGDYGSQVGHKFVRGLGNAATGWLEIPKNIAIESEASNVGMGVTWGLLKGVGHTVGRTIVGVVELATFFIPNGEIVHPTWAWEPFDRETSYNMQ